MKLLFLHAIYFALQLFKFISLLLSLFKVFIENLKKNNLMSLRVVFTHDKYICAIKVIKDYYIHVLKIFFAFQMFSL